MGAGAGASAASSRSVTVRAVATAPEASKVSISKFNFPFACIQGQEEMKLALTLSVVDPNIGGVLVMGDRGTGKSVAVRALIDLLPDIEVVEGDAFNSSPTDAGLMGPDALERFRGGQKLKGIRVPTPLVELPLGATEDRICGTIDIEKALTQGVKAYEPGLLAKANRGILYVDEVNLLDDGLVDVVLDSAASGVNTVEREGISIAHPAKFIMIGSGNPAEGELRPQLLDRFGLSVQVKTMQDTQQRTQMVLDRLAFETNPEALMARVQPQQAVLTAKITDARKRLTSVKVPYKIQLLISEICSRLEVDGLRGDIVINRACKALVAYEGRKEVTLADVERLVGVCLNHRMRKDPLDPIDNGLRVALLFKRMTDPEVIKREEEMMRKRKEAEAKAIASGGSGAGAGRDDSKKAGAWQGLPGLKR